MAKYNFYISYSHRDGQELARRLENALTKRGYSVFMDVNSLQAGANLPETIDGAIAQCDCFLPIITEGYLHSQWCIREAIVAANASRKRAKDIIPLLATSAPWPVELDYLLGTYHCCTVPDNRLTPEILARIEAAVGRKIKISALYDRLAEYRELNHPRKESEALCQLVELMCAQIPNEWGSRRRSASMDICRLLEQLSRYRGQYGPEAKKAGRRMQTAIDHVQKLLSSPDMGKDIFSLAFAVRLAYWDWDVRNTSFDLIYSGDVFQGLIDPYPLRKGMTFQAPHVQAFEEALNQAGDALNADFGFSADEIDFIMQTASFVLHPDSSSDTAPLPAESQPVSLDRDEEILLAVANHLQESNKLFDMLQARGAAGDFLKCLLTSYERLKNYCQIVGAQDVAADCVDRIVEIRDLIARQDGAAPGNEKAENGLKSLLGFTLRSSGSYDVFISYKNEDADLAEKVYRLCQRHMKVPFWSKRTLPELSKSEYEDAIYDALRKARHFVVVLSRVDYLQASWIQREMKAFDRAITEQRKPGGNFVFVVTDDVYSEIIGCNKMCLDERYCGYQIIKMSDYEQLLPQYFT